MLLKVIFGLALLFIAPAHVSGERHRASPAALAMDMQAAPAEDMAPEPEEVVSENLEMAWKGAQVARSDFSKKDGISATFSTVILAVPILALLIGITAVLAVHTERGWEVMSALGLAEHEFNGKAPAHSGMLASLVWQAAQVLDEWLPLANPKGKAPVSLRDAEGSVEMSGLLNEEPEEDHDDFDPSSEIVGAASDCQRLPSELCKEWACSAATNSNFSADWAAWPADSQSAPEQSEAVEWSEFTSELSSPEPATDTQALDQEISSDSNCLEVPPDSHDSQVTDPRIPGEFQSVPVIQEFLQNQVDLVLEDDDNKELHQTINPISTNSLLEEDELGL